MKQATNKYAVPALDKGLDILEFLATQEIARSQTEIANALGRTPNEIYRVLVGLEARGYLHRDELSGKYQVSLKIYNLSRRISPVDKVRQCALPHMEDLAFSTGHACHLCMLYKSQTMVIIQARSHTPVSISIAEGSLFPTLSTASGKVLLANSNPEVQQMLLDRDEAFNNMSEVKQRVITDELAQIKTDGYHAEESQFTVGVKDFAALIGKPEGLVVASLAVSSLNTTLSSQIDSTELENKIIETARKITEQLGCD